MVKPLGHVDDATAIYMEPLDCSDWELMEINSDFLESGGLLQQVSIVYPNQILPLWVGGRDVLRVKVLSRSFYTSDEDSSDEDASYDQEERPVCLRLVADTEVIVTPKPRPFSSAELKMSAPLRVYPTWEDWSFSMQSLQDEAPATPLSVPPLSLYAHPDTLDQCMPGWTEANQTTRASTHPTNLAVLWNSNRDKNDVEERLLQREGNEEVDRAVVRVCASQDIPYGHVGESALRLHCT